MAGPEAFATLLQPILDHGIQALKSTLEKHIPLPDLHEQLDTALGWLLVSQKDKDKEASSRKPKDTTYFYRRWTDRVSDIEKRVNYLNDEYEHWKKNSESENWKKKFPSWIKQRDLEKNIKEALKDVTGLLEKCPEKILVDHEVPERVIEEAGVPSIKKYLTLQKAFQEIQDLIQLDGVKCVALHGQKGVGKTTIMQHLNNHFHDRADFDMVIFIKMAADEKTNDLYILQKIADRINVDGEGSELKVSGRIQRVLKDKRYLLILDGVRHQIDGIWKNLDISKHEKDSKVVIATHYALAWKSACVQRDVELNKLSPNEAWQMFRGIVGDKLDDIRNAQLVCKRFCCCLPLLIYHIASSLKPKASREWEKALKELTPWPKVGVEGLAQLYQHLKISYDLLDQSTQKCFLYASLYPASSNIFTRYLAECCIVQRFLHSDDEAETGYKILRGRVIYKILRDLVDVSFLEQGEQMRYVKMNYFYSQLALYILSEDSNLEGRTYPGNEKHEECPLGQDSRQNAKWFSRIGSKSDDLPTNQNCGSLEVLLLQRNMKLVEFSPNCFESMGNLLVLNLYRTKISKLPSLEGLTNLKAFYLNGCSKLKIDPNEIEALKHLEVFDIRDTKVGFVPCLKSLCCLRISCIASGNYRGISQLHKLEELTIEVKSLQTWCNNAQCIVKEVASASLKKFTTLRCSFYSSESREDFLKASEAWRHEKTQSLPFGFLYDVKTPTI